MFFVDSSFPKKFFQIFFSFKLENVLFSITLETSRCKLATFVTSDKVFYSISLQAEQFLNSGEEFLWVGLSVCL